MSAAPDVVHEVLSPVDPATLSPLPVVPVTEPAELAEVVAEARVAQVRWAQTPFAERAALLRRVAQAIVADDLGLAHAIVDESGKPLVEAYTHDLFVAVEALVWLGRETERVLRPERLRSRQPVLLHKRRQTVLREPLGVVGVIAPWNFPIGLPMTQAATAVAAGNAVVIKPSELVPNVGRRIEQLFVEAGAPPGLVRVVSGGADVGAALVAHHGVDAVVFTGSTATGRQVGARAAERLCPVTLELGGKDPMLVLDDADLGRAVPGALWAAFANCGQVCSGVERIYVDRSLHGAFLERFSERAVALRLGDGHDVATELGPLVSERQRRLVEELVADAREHGATVVTGGNRWEGLAGWFHEPTVLSGEPEHARIRREEVFGPVVTVVPVDDAREAVRRANDSPFALGASVWTRDHRRASAVAAELRAGSVWHNDHAYSYGAMQAPWGGRGASGFGRTHGREGLLASTQTKFTDADSGRITPGWWYPYSADVLDGFRGVLGALYEGSVRGRAGRLRRHRAGVRHLLRKAIS